MAEHQIAIISVSFAYTFAAKILTLISSQLKAGDSLQKYSTVGLTALENKRLLEQLEHSDVSAIIGVSIRPDAAVVANYRKVNIPVILVDEEINNASTVASDNYLGGYIAGEHFIKKERSNICVVSGRMNIEGGFNAIQRVNGIRAALKKYGKSIDDNRIIEVRDYSYFDGINAMKTILDRFKDTDAIFCAAGDECAKGLMETATKSGVKIPQNIAIIGYDDMELAKATNPPLTTIKQPLEKIAALAYEMATTSRLDVLEENRKKLHFPPSW